VTASEETWRGDSASARAVSGVYDSASARALAPTNVLLIFHLNYKFSFKL
jgi:hypothetical protein